MTMRPLSPSLSLIVLYVRVCVAVTTIIAVLRAACRCVYVYYRCHHHRRGVCCHRRHRRTVCVIVLVTVCVCVHRHRLI